MDKNRRSIRVPGFDYSVVGEYFVTIVTYHRQPLFGQIENGEMHANILGTIAIDEWFKTATLRKNVILFENEFVLMPNHIHRIVHIVEKDSPESNINEASVGAQRRCAPTVAQNDHKINGRSGSLGEILRAYKSAVTYAINHIHPEKKMIVWQRNYYEHIICSVEEYAQVEGYILNNPINWLTDEENNTN
jgi:REP element-mobilizing transposase RayT